MKIDCRVKANLGWDEGEHISNDSCIPKREFIYRERDDYRYKRYQLDVES